MTARTATFLKERRCHYRHISRIYALCRSGEWSLKLDRLLDGGKANLKYGLVDERGQPRQNVEGTFSDERDLIVTEFRSDLLMTFIHECLHILHGDSFEPEADADEEAWVLEQEAIIKRHLSPVQGKRLLQHMVRILK